jgi:hypothetical protein
LQSSKAFSPRLFQAAGFKTVILSNGRFDLRRYYRLAGVSNVITWANFRTRTDSEWIAQQLGRLGNLHDWLALKYRGVHVGRFAVASTMRGLRQGQLDFTNPAVAAELKRSLEASLGFALAAEQIFAEVKPDCVLLLDRGYVGQGELFDLAIDRKIDALTWNGGYRSNLIFLKRYNAGNERDHHASLSAESWAHMLSVPWKKEYGDCVRNELFRLYQTQDWFSSVGTQFGKTILADGAVRQRLGLEAGKKVAVIFPHILWDGSFFWGDDLFDDYTHWFTETIRAACANPRLEWIVKVHPSHVVKAKKDNATGRPQELDVIDRTVGKLPPHVKLLLPESEISTYSIFEIADYAITVRGTVGLEASLFGMPVITAGTGRYAGRGFTTDSATASEYLERLRTLDNHPPLTPEQKELAERYAFGVLFSRPLPLESVSLEFERDAVASWRVAVRCKSREDWLNARDIRRFAEWLSGNKEDMFAWPAVI